jgi:fumarate reductase subunit D
MLEYIFKEYEHCAQPPKNTLSHLNSDNASKENMICFLLLILSMWSGVQFMVHAYKKIQFEGD